MPESSLNSASPSQVPHRSRHGLWSFTLVFSTLAPVMVAILVYHLDPFDPAPLPIHDSARQGPAKPSLINDRLLHGAEFLGEGQLPGPEDVLYDPSSRLIYTGCEDGWIYRVTINESACDSVVEKWVRTGGRPLGLVFGQHKELIVADSYVGLLKVSENVEVELLADEAEGLKFLLTDGVAVAEDGMIYFTDASYKYRLHDYIWDILEGKPHGRLLSYDPITKETKVLARDLYFPNGIAMSPDQNYVVFCETPMRRCSKYYINGEEKGRTESWIDNLPGFPDNIRYDGDGLYWIALPTAYTRAWDLAQRYPFIRKVVGIMEKYMRRPSMEANSGVFAVDLEGKAVAYYYDPRLSLITSGVKIGNHLYTGSIYYSYIMRLDLTQHPARATA